MHSISIGQIIPPTVFLYLILNTDFKTEYLESRILTYDDNVLYLN